MIIYLLSSFDDDDLDDVADEEPLDEADNAGVSPTYLVRPT